MPPTSATSKSTKDAANPSPKGAGNRQNAQTDSRLVLMQQNTAAPNNALSGGEAFYSVHEDGTQERASHPNDGSGSGSGSGSSDAGFTPKQMAELTAMLSSMLANQLPKLLSQGTHGVAGIATHGLSQASPANPPGLGRSSAAKAEDGSATQAGPSFAAAFAGHAGTQTVASYVASNTGLYGNQDKIASSLPALKALPKDCNADSFEEWKRIAINDMINTGGMREVVTLPHADSLRLAIDTDTAHRPPEVIRQLWKMLHAKACAVLKTAFYPAVKDTLTAEAELEQRLHAGDFIQDNANWLWERATRQFRPDHIARLVRGFSALEQLKFVAGKTLPNAYNTQFRSAINDIRAADPSQNFTDRSLLALYIKGWPAELAQQLAMLKGLATPTLETAQQLLQQWWNDNGKKKPSAPSTPAPSDSLAALAQADQKKRKKENRKQREGSDDSSSPRPQGRNVQLGAMVDSSSVPTFNRFDSLSDAPDSIAAVSVDGAEEWTRRDEFLLDSGATRNVVSDQSLLHDVEPLPNPVYMRCAMGSGAMLRDHGRVKLSRSVTLRNCAYAKGSKLNAISISRAADSGVVTVFGKKKAMMIRADAFHRAMLRVPPKDIVLEVPRVGDLYIFKRAGAPEEERDSKSNPDLEVKRPTGSIPLKGEKTASSKTGTQTQSASTVARQELQAKRQTRAASAASAVANAKSPAAGTTPSTSSSSTTSSSASPARASTNAYFHAALCAEYGLDLDTELEFASWYSLREQQA
jgi:hypothetical protein